MNEYLIVTFESSNFAMQAEAFFKQHERACQIMPTPREITLSCGLSIRALPEDIGFIEDGVELKSIRVKAVYKCNGSASNRQLEKIL